MNITGEIRSYLGNGDYAQLKFSETKTSFSIDIVMVPASHRKQGIGTTLINRILMLADSMGKDVYVSARPIGTSSEGSLQRLITYYMRFGFELVDTGLTTAFMLRKATPSRIQNTSITYWNRPLRDDVSEVQ